MRLAFLRFVIGFIAGVLLWSATAPAYTKLLAWGSAPLIRIDSRFREADVEARGTTMRVSSAVPRFPSLDFKAEQITYNVILLIALFAANPAPWRRRNVGRFFGALAITCVTHFLAVIIWIEASYSVIFDDWSIEHYESFAANAWTSAQLLYQVVGMFGVVFILWWMSRENGNVR